MVEWEKAPERVAEIVRETIEKHHPRLKDARVGVLFRSKAAKSAGREIIGKASTVNAKWRAILGAASSLHFIIWFAEDWWQTASLLQKRALTDHELCHCTWGNTGPAMRGHDVEEFTEIIERHGIWKGDLKPVAQAFSQAPLIEMRGAGEVITLTPGEWDSAVKQQLQEETV